MKKMLMKEIRLAASPLSFWFLAAAALTFVPGYPILLGTFFLTLGIFYSFQTTRENNDIGYSLLLPVAKKDIVKGKYLFVLFIEGCGFLAMTVFTLIRMVFLSDAAAYTKNALMCANLTFLGFVLLIYGIFNLVFVGGFFRTAYKFGKPFIFYIIFAMLIVVLAESLHHFPGLGGLNCFGFTEIVPQLIALAAGALLFAAFTLLGIRNSIKRFEKIDL